MSLIDIRGVSLQYGDRKVIKHVSVQIEQGEFFVIIGPNGAGKTTLLKALSGLQSLVGGDIHVHHCIPGIGGHKCPPYGVLNELF